MRYPLVSLLVLALVSVGGAARADLSKTECVAADTAAQNERRASHFRAAKEQLEICSRLECPKLVRDDCNQRLLETEALVPTVVFAAKDASGEDVLGVKVSLDGGDPIELTGTAIAVDPGVHTFAFTAPGAKPIEKKLVIREGEKARQEKITFADLNPSPAVAVAQASTPPPPSQQAQASTWSNQKTAALVVGGVGVAGIVVGAALGALSFSSWSSSQNDCSSDTKCPNRSGALTEHGNAITDATVSDIGFIAGGVLVAGGVVLFLTAPSASSNGSGGRGFWVVPSATPHGSGLRIEGRF